MVLVPELRHYEMVKDKVEVDKAEAATCIGQCTGCMCNCRCSCRNSPVELKW